MTTTEYGPADLSTLFETLYCLTPEEAAAEQAAKDARDAKVLADNGVQSHWTIKSHDDWFFPGSWVVNYGAWSWPSYSTLRVAMQPEA